MKKTLITNLDMKNFIKKFDTLHDKSIAENTQDEIAQEFSKIGLEDYSSIAYTIEGYKFNTSDYAEALKEISEKCFSCTSLIERN